MKNYAEMKHCVEMNTQTIWLIDTNLSVECRILRIVEFGLKLLDCSKKSTIWTWVAKNMNCKIPILQVGWRFKLIQYSLNSQYCLENWMKSLGKQEFTYIYFSLTKIVTAQTWTSRVSDYWIKGISEQSLYWVIYHSDSEVK